jgi:hypothetical protein
MDDTDDVLYSPSNELAGMLHCNPLEDTIAESPVVRTRLAVKFDSAQEIGGSEDSTVMENSLPPPKKSLQDISLLQRLSSVDEEAPSPSRRLRKKIPFWQMQEPTMGQATKSILSRRLKQSQQLNWMLTK